jgi:hypothetical protein
MRTLVPSVFMSAVFSRLSPGQERAVIGYRRLICRLSGFEILFGVSALADHDHAPIDLDLVVLDDGRCFREVRLRGGEG